MGNASGGLQTARWSSRSHRAHWTEVPTYNALSEGECPQWITTPSVQFGRMEQERCLSADSFAFDLACIRAVLATLQNLRDQLMFSCTNGTATSTSCSGKTGGWYPRDAMKGHIPVADDVKELCAYSTQRRNGLREAELRLVTQRRTVPKSWLALSFWPLGWRW